MFIGTTIKVILLLTMCMSTMAFVQAYQWALYKWSTDAGLTHDGSRVSQWDNYGSNSSVYLQQWDYNCRPYMNQKLLKGISVVSFNGNDENTLCESLWSANAWNNFVIPTDINFSAINIFLVQSTNFRSSAYSNNSIASESLNQWWGWWADGSYRIEFNNENITWMAWNNNSNMSTTWAWKQIFNGANSMNNPGWLEYRDKPMVRWYPLMIWSFHRRLIGRR